MGGEGSGRPTKEMQIVKRLSGHPANQKGFAIGSSATGDLIMPNYGGLAEGARKDAREPFLTSVDAAATYVKKAGDTMTGTLTLPTQSLTNYSDIVGVSTPSNPATATRRLFNDAATGKLSVRTNAGTTISLEEQGTSDHGALTGLADDDHTQYAEIANTESITGVWTHGTNTKLQFRDTGLYIYSSADGQLDIEADVLLKLGLAGDIELGDTTLRVLKPVSNEKIDLGTSSLRFNDIQMGGNLTIDSGNIITDTTTGMKIGTSTTQKLGFYNSTPVVKQSAFTQTYSTQTKTHANLTAGTTGGTADATYDSVEQTMLNDLKTNLNALRDDVINLKGVVNALIDDLQLYGLIA